MATKKKAAPAEEVQKAQEGAQNDAQSVKSPEPIEEPATTQNAPEGEENAPEERGATPLSLDTIDSLVLPGDSELGEEGEQPQRWSITDDGCADWALKKIKAEQDEYDRVVALAEQDEYDRVVALAEQEMARLTELVEKAGRRLQSNTAFLTSMLEQFFRTVEHKKTKTGTETYRLLHGQLVCKPAGFQPKPNHEKLVAWLRANGYEKLVKVEEKAAWGDFKKKLAFMGTIATIKDTGEIVEGIDIEEVPPAFSVKF